jgi:hypothetical protein
VYWKELTGFLIAVVIAAVLAVLTPQHQKAKLDKEGRLKRA